jgi:hypothetical protein
LVATGSIGSQVGTAVAAEGVDLINEVNIEPKEDEAGDGEG